MFTAIFHYQLREWALTWLAILCLTAASTALAKSSFIAESNETVKLEGNHYFPPGSVMTQFLRESSTHTLCSWKGKASYYDIVVDDSINRDAAWYYPEPKQEALNIKNYVAFWHGVEAIQ